jgi:hypothetical protein
MLSSSERIVGISGLLVAGLFAVRTRLMGQQAGKLCVFEGSMQKRTNNIEIRGSLVERALRLEWLSAAWMLTEAGVAIGSSIAAHSLALVAFGADSVIELLSRAFAVLALDSRAPLG